MSGMKVDKVKRMAAELLGVGESRIWIDPTKLEEVSGVVSKEDVRRLIKDGIIKKLPEESNSRARWRVRHEQRKKGRRRGPGKRKGVKTARQDPKEVWMGRIRRMRRFLRYLRDHEIIDRRTYRRLYMLAKGGMFHSLSHLKLYLKEHYGVEVK